jgi:hypothetical protein
LILALVFSFDTRLEAACIEPAQLAHVAVSITRYFDEGESVALSGVIGARGTAWFLSPTTLVTAEHVTTGMKLTTQEWKPLEIRDGKQIRSIAARLQRAVGTAEEKLAVIELQTAHPEARRAEIRTAPLAPEDRVVTFAYTEGRPRVVGGRFVKYGDDERLAGAAMLEMFDGDDRLAIDHGASGAPVYDCDGRITAVVTTVITQAFPGLSGRMRVSTPWGTPNVVSVPIREMTDSLQVR